MAYNGFGVYTTEPTAMRPDDRVSADIAGDHEKELADMTAENAVLKAQLERALAVPRTDSRSSRRTDNENENPANVPHPTPHVESTARDNPPGQAQKLQLKCNLPKLLGTRGSPALLVADTGYYSSPDKSSSTRASLSQENTASPERNPDSLSRTQWHEKEKRETNPGSSSAESNGIQRDLSVFEMSMIGLFGHPVSGQGTAGVGLHFTKQEHEDYATIVGIVPRFSAALEKSLRVGLAMTHIDGNSLQGKNSGDIVCSLTGEENTKVSLQLLDLETNQSWTVTLIRTLKHTDVSFKSSEHFEGKSPFEEKSPAGAGKAPGQLEKLFHGLQIRGEESESLRMRRNGILVDSTSDIPLTPRSSSSTCATPRRPTSSVSTTSTTDRTRSNSMPVHFSLAESPPLFPPSPDEVADGTPRRIFL